MLPHLTEEALDRIAAGEEVVKPILQVLAYNKIYSLANDERFRLLISDGVKFNSFTMLATQLNGMINSNVLTERSIVEVKRYAITTIKHCGTDRKVMVIIEMDVLVTGNQVDKLSGAVNVDNAMAEEANRNSTLQPDAAIGPVYNQQIEHEATTSQAGNTSNNLNDTLTRVEDIVMADEVNRNSTLQPDAAIGPVYNQQIEHEATTSRAGNTSNNLNDSLTGGEDIVMAEVANCNATQQPDPATGPTMNQQVATKATASHAGTTSNNLNDSQSGRGDISTTPIAALSPYHNRWVIRARVTNKSHIRTWSNSRGEGKFFSSDLLDQSGEIRCTAFNEQCDKFYDKIETGKVYYITRCTLKPANKQFNNLKNDYEMTIGDDTKIAACNMENQHIPEVQFNFVPISAVEHKPKDQLIDVLGIVKICTDVKSLTARTTGRELKKRDLSIIDESNVMVNVTLWGQQAQEFRCDDNSVVALKVAKIGEFNGGNNLSLVSSSLFQIDPDLPEAHRLRGWFMTVGSSHESRSLSKLLADGGSINCPRSTFKQVEEQRFGHPEQPNQFITKVNLIKSDNALYKACPADGCKKKLVELGNGMYKCDKCQREYPNFVYRLLASANLVDWTGNKWATAFNEQAEVLFGASAAELGALKETNNDAFLKKIGEATFKSYNFKLRLKQDTYNEDNEMKATVVSIEPINYKVYTGYLLDKIQKLANIKK